LICERSRAGAAKVSERAVEIQTTGVEDSTPRAAGVANR